MSNVTYLPWVPSEEPTAGPVFKTAEPEVELAAEGESERSSELAAASPDEVYESLLRKLAMADMSAHEVRLWLRERDLDENAVDEILGKVEHLGYVDDFRLAEQVVGRLVLRKGQGRSAIALELRKRNLGQSAIDEALANIDQGDELNRAIDQALKRAPSVQRFDRVTAERRLHGFLSRRGYPSGVVREAIHAAFSEYPPVG